MINLRTGLLVIALGGLFLQLNCSAQANKNGKPDAKQKELDRLNEIFGEDDPDFSVTAVPDKWKKESAVILCQKHSYTFDKAHVFGHGHCLIDREVIRKRIKLMDKASVDDFSEFYFTSTKDIGIRIVKANGETINVDMNNAVEVSSDINIPSIFRSNRSGYTIRSSYKKLAINNLEPGDIIDYFYKVEQLESIATYRLYGHEVADFSPVVMSLCSSYPVVKQKLIFVVEKGFYINEKSTNGAPVLKEQLLDKKNSWQFSLVDSDRDKFKDERWAYQYRATPTIKFEVVFPLEGVNHSEGFFLGQTGVPKTSVTPDEVKKVISRRVRELSGYSEDIWAKIMLYLGAHCKNDKDPKELAKSAYYYFRYLFDDATTSGNAKNGVNSSQCSDEAFVEILAKLFARKNIDYKVMVGVAKSIGSLQDFVLKDELYWFIKVEGSTPLYIYPLATYSNLLDKQYLYEGIEAYEIKTDNNSKNSEIKKVTVPGTTFDQNTHKEIISATIDDEMDIVTLAKEYHVTGHSKSNYYNYVVLQRDYMKKEQEKFFIKQHRLSPKDAEKAAREDAAEAEKENKARKENAKEVEGDDYDIESFDEFKLIQDGRQFDQQELAFSEKFKVKDLIKKAGSNYILEVGKLIGGQVTIDEDEMKRQYDIYLSYPYSISYEVKVTIPEDYTVDGFDKLNFSASNETGMFTSKATIEGNTLKISVQKAYKQSFVKKEDWPKMTTFLDAAYKFTQGKVVLRKQR